MNFSITHRYYVHKTNPNIDSVNTLFAICEGWKVCRAYFKHLEHGLRELKHDTKLNIHPDKTYCELWDLTTHDTYTSHIVDEVKVSHLPERLPFWNPDTALHHPGGL